MIVVYFSERLVRHAQDDGCESLATDALRAMLARGVDATRRFGPNPTPLARALSSSRLEDLGKIPEGGMGPSGLERPRNESLAESDSSTQSSLARSQSPALAARGLAACVDRTSTRRRRVCQ